MYHQPDEEADGVLGLLAGRVDVAHHEQDVVATGQRHQPSIVVHLAAGLDTTTACRCVSILALVDHLVRHPASVPARLPLARFPKCDVDGVNKGGGHKVSRRIRRDWRTVTRLRVVLVAKIAVHADLNIATPAPVLACRVRLKIDRVLVKAAAPYVAKAARAGLLQVTIDAHPSAKLHTKTPSDTHPRPGSLPLVLRNRAPTASPPPALALMMYGRVRTRHAACVTQWVRFDRHWRVGVGEYAGKRKRCGLWRACL